MTQHGGSVILIRMIHKDDSGFATVFTILALVGILVLGSVSIVGAANNAVPGNTLYPVDMGLEEVQLSLTSNPQAQVDLRTQLAEERLVEALQVFQEQGAGAPGIDVALVNLAEQKAQINILISQNQELQVKVRSLEIQLQQKQQGLKSAFQTVGQDLEAQLKNAKKSGNTIEASRLETQLDALEMQKEALDDEDEIEEQKEVEEEKEITENGEGEGNED